MADDPLVPFFAWNLGNMLANLEQQKGGALTEIEVLTARDSAVVIAIPRSKRDAIDAKRGCRDLDPANLWEEWQQFRLQLAADGGIEDVPPIEDRSE